MLSSSDILLDVRPDNDGCFHRNVVSRRKRAVYNGRPGDVTWFVRVTFTETERDGRFENDARWLPKRLVLELLPPCHAFPGPVQCCHTKRVPYRRRQLFRNRRPASAANVSPAFRTPSPADWTLHVHRVRIPRGAQRIPDGRLHFRTGRSVRTYARINRPKKPNTAARKPRVTLRQRVLYTRRPSLFCFSSFTTIMASRKRPGIIFSRNPTPPPPGVRAYYDKNRRRVFYLLLFPVRQVPSSHERVSRCFLNVVPATS